LIKKIDNLGRVVVPKGYRMMLGLQPGDPLDVEVDGGRLMISPHKDGCTFCGMPDGLHSYLDKSICPGCLDQLKNLDSPA
jgi:AbrB family transcriptional regulator, transcriptional pleiotropic regulator of transition state genes